MGPCPFRHGYLVVRPAGGGARTKLQWGHALSGMDMTTPQPILAGLDQRFNGAMPFQAWISHSDMAALRAYLELQWGHALSGMDTSLKS